MVQQDEFTGQPPWCLPGTGYTRLEASGIHAFLPGPQIQERDPYARGVFDLELDESAPFHRMRLDTTLRLLEPILASCPDGGRLLDVGCGVGQTLEAMARSWPRLDLTGMDLSLTALEKAASRLPAAHWVLCDCAWFPFRDAHFQVVLLNNLIEHVPDPAPLLGRIARVLAPGGYLLVSTPSRYRLDNLLRALRGLPLQRMSPDHIVELSVGQVSEMLAWAGFHLEKVEGPRRPPNRRTFKNTLSRALLVPAARAWLASVRSPHVLESTAFYLARRADGGVPG